MKNKLLRKNEIEQANSSTVSNSFHHKGNSTCKVAVERRPMMDQQMNYGEDYKFIPASSINNGIGKEVLPDLYCYTVQIVNVILAGDPASDDFVLIDAGMPQSADSIIRAVEDRFGAGSKPKAIILTHGHFDHVGAIIELIQQWNVPVYAHEMELPFLQGEKSYPEPDTTVEGGMVAKMSKFFPIEPIQLGDSVRALPDDGTVPYLPEYRWIHTPGHSPGHISLFRDRDGALIVGDAFVTVKQEYLYEVFMQEKEISGPPRYLTTDWVAAEESVKLLKNLNPTVAITGHGVPFIGKKLSKSLQHLVEDFEDLAKPDYGKYIH